MFERKVFHTSQFGPKPATFLPGVSRKGGAGQSEDNAANYVAEGIVQGQTLDQESFARLYDAFFPRLYSYVSYRAASREEAEDIVAMVFEQILAKFHTFNPKRGSLDTWIFSIARNALTDRHRYRSRHREHALEDYLELEADISLSDQFLKREELEQLRTYLGRLSEREQELVVLRYGAGLPHRRIGELLKMNEGSVAVYLSRILRKLHRFFQEDAEEKASLGLQE